MAKDIIPQAPKKPLGVLLAEKGVSEVVAAGLRGLRRWDDLLEVSEAELDAAIHDYQSIRLGR